MEDEAMRDALRSPVTDTKNTLVQDIAFISKDTTERHTLNEDGPHYRNQRSTNLFPGFAIVPDLWRKKS